MKPTVRLMFSALGVSARVDVLPEPRLRGADEALDRTIIEEIVRDNPMVDLYLLMVDRDCDRRGNEQRALERENEHRSRLIACCAWQEIEVWMLSAYKERLGAPWAAVRADCDPKERYADALLAELGTLGPGHGRKSAMRKVRFDDLMTCSELRSLFERLKVWKERGLARS